MSVIGIVIDVDSQFFTFKVFENFDHNLNVGSFVYLKDNDGLILAKVVKIFRKNYLATEKLVAQVSIDDLESLREYGIDVKSLAYVTFAKAIIIGKWCGRFERTRKIPKILDYVYYPEEKELELMFKVKDEATCLEIGYLRQYERLRVSVNADKLVTHHCAILAATGGGKSWLAGVLAEELLVKVNIPIIIIDPHSEYSSMQITADRVGLELSDYEKKLAEKIINNVEIYIPGKVDTSTIDNYFKRKFGIDRKYCRFGISPTSLSTGIVMKLLDYYYGLTDTQRRILEEGWQYVYPIRSDELVSIDEIVREVINYGKCAAPKGYAGEMAVSSLATKLKLLLESRPFFITRPGEYFGDEPLRLFDPRKVISRSGIKILDLGGLDIIDQQALVSVILDSIFNLAIKRQAPPMFIIIEEAHNFAPSKGDALSLPSIMRIAREGRKFGVGLCIISQRPARIHPDILSQCSTHFIKRIINPNDLKYVRDVVEHLSIEELSEVKLLNDDEVLITGLAVPVPILAKVRKRYTAHGGITPTLTTQGSIPLEAK